MNAEEARDIAEDVEEERAKLNLSECTPLTFEIFQQWRTSRKIQRDAEIEAERKAAAKKDGHVSVLPFFLSLSVFLHPFFLHHFFLHAPL